jgi:hypothetical protein
MIDYNKTEIREQVKLENVFDLLQEWGGDPEYTAFGIISATICHNKPGEGSRKLYYYENSGLFQCYTGCQGYFDIFEMVCKIMDIQQGLEFDLNDAVRWIATKLGISGTIRDDNAEETGMEDWVLLANYSRIQEITPKEKQEIILKEYDKAILSRLNYSLRLEPWLNEHINQEVIEYAQIGYYLGGDQITIPHFDKDNRFVGLRGRTMCKEEAEKFGKYRPIKCCGQMYNHPLGMNLYGYSWAKDNIKAMKKAIIFESEKSVLMYMSYFGIENNIAVACCGSNISAYQIQLLIDAGAEEIIVAFDRQFQEIGDKEHQHLVKNFKTLHNKFKNYVLISFMFDKQMITGYKASPIDEGVEKFMTLFKERVVL